MEENISIFTKIISIFWEPTKTFEAIGKKVSALDIVIPMILLCIVSWVSIPYVTPLAIKTQKAKIENSDKIPEEQKQAIIEKMEEKQNPVWGYIFAPVGIAIGTLLMGLVFLFAGNFILGGESKFTTIWGIVLYSSLVDLVATAVKVPLMLQKGTLNVYTSIAIFMQESQSFLFQFMKHIDVFNLWKVILISIGLSVVYKKKLSNVSIIVMVIWVIYCAAAAGLTGLSPF